MFDPRAFTGPAERRNIAASKARHLRISREIKLIRTTVEGGGAGFGSRVGLRGIPVPTLRAGLLCDSATIQGAQVKNAPIFARA